MSGLKGKTKIIWSLHQTSLWTEKEEKLTRKPRHVSHALHERTLRKFRVSLTINLHGPTNPLW